MITAVVLSYITVILVGSTHFLMISRGTAMLRRRFAAPDKRIFMALSLIFVVHLFEAGLFAVTFIAGRALSIGEFSPGAPLSTMDIYYFSMVNYTTLGLGDIYPRGHLRFIAAVEAFIGFLLLSCSASMLFGIVQDKVKNLVPDQQN